MISSDLYVHLLPPENHPETMKYHPTSSPLTWHLDQPQTGECTCETAFVLKDR